MSKEQKTPAVQDVPAIVKKAPELLPLWDWWVKEGRSTLLMLVVIGLAAAAFYGGRNWLRGRNAAANAALANAFTTEEMETAVADYGKTKVGPALKLRLAKSYFDAERYQDALDTYDALLAAPKKIAAFAAVAAVGRAYALEGLGKYDEAGAAFAAAAQDETSYLRLTAQLGAARCKALAGDKDGAAKAFAALKDAAADDATAKLRIERMEDAVKRHDPSRAARSLFDAANEAAAAVAAETESKPAETKPADAKPADVKPAEAKPAETPAAN